MFIHIRKAFKFTVLKFQQFHINPIIIKATNLFDPHITLENKLFDCCFFYHCDIGEDLAI